MLILYYVLSLILLAPASAYAYLDPGTGNILVYIVISLIGAFIFSLKGLFYKIAGKKDLAGSGALESSNFSKIVLFSEGKNYWNTFKPIIEALRKRKQPFSYYTMDVDDPALTIEDPIINNRYIGKGNMAFTRIGKLKADTVLSTTPNIGTPEYPIPKSPNIKNLVHVFHAVDDLAYYHKGSLDNYDAVLLVGEFETPLIRKLENIRNLPPKELIPAGLPYMDELASQMKKEMPNTDGKTILIGPSWGTKGCLSFYGSEFLEDLAARGYNLIIRPHPQSWKVEISLLEKIKRKLDKYPNVTWDKDPDGSKSLESSDLLISDTSAIRFDYAFLYQRPVITLETVVPDPEGFEIIDLQESYMETILAEIGYSLNKENISQLGEKVDSILQSSKKYDVESLRNKTIYNWGNSGSVIADYLINAAKGTESAVTNNDL